MIEYVKSITWPKFGRVLKEIGIIIAASCVTITFVQLINIGAAKFLTLFF